MMWQAVTVPPPHWTNRYAGASPRSAGRSRHPSAHDAGYMSLISSKKSQYICSLSVRACSDGPAASASRTASAHSLLKNLGSATLHPPARTGCTCWISFSMSGARSMPTSFSLRRNCWKNSSRKLNDVGIDLAPDRSEEHTSELQSRQYLVCRLLLEKKK